MLQVLCLRIILPGACNYYIFLILYVIKHYMCDIRHMPTIVNKNVVKLKEIQSCLPVIVIIPIFGYHLSCLCECALLVRNGIPLSLYSSIQMFGYIRQSIDQINAAIMKLFRNRRWATYGYHEPPPPPHLNETKFFWSPGIY